MRYLHYYFHKFTILVVYTSILDSILPAGKYVLVPVTTTSILQATRTEALMLYQIWTRGFDFRGDEGTAGCCFNVYMYS